MNIMKATILAASFLILGLLIGWQLKNQSTRTSLYQENQTNSSEKQRSANTNVVPGSATLRRAQTTERNFDGKEEKCIQNADQQKKNTGNCLIDGQWLRTRNIPKPPKH
ncbi:MAG TPA: hypothetical protein VJR90_05165 [Gammaproteobacteria bacterium]|nr:hypothetical protein [Gammaproteobacteria bacterium]